MLISPSERLAGMAAGLKNCEGHSKGNMRNKNSTTRSPQPETLFWLLAALCKGYHTPYKWRMCPPFLQYATIEDIRGRGRAGGRVR
jgi:hypothetical protein